MSKGIGIITLPLVARSLGPEEFGIVGSMIALSSTLTIFLGFSLERSTNRLYYESDDVNYRRELLGNIVISIFLISSIITIILYFLKDYKDFFILINRFLSLLLLYNNFCLFTNFFLIFH